MTDRQARLEADREHSVDRRRVSRDSKRRIAEAIKREETTAALRDLFEVVTGDAVADHPPVRDVAGRVELGDSASLSDNRVCVVAVTVGKGEHLAFVDLESGGSYAAPECAEGVHDVAASVKEVREYDPDTLKSTRYGIESASVELSASQVGIDTASVAIGERVVGPSVTVTELSVGPEITESQ